MGHNPFEGLRCPAYQILTLQFITIAKLRSSNKIILRLWVTTTWGTVLQGHSVREVANTGLRDLMFKGCISIPAAITLWGLRSSSSNTERVKGPSASRVQRQSTGAVPPGPQVAPHQNMSPLSTQAGFYLVLGLQKLKSVAPKSGRMFGTASVDCQRNLQASWLESLSELAGTWTIQMLPGISPSSNKSVRALSICDGSESFCFFISGTGLNL